MNSNCVLCLVPLPLSSKRRRLYGLSSSIVLQLLQTEVDRLGVRNIIPPRPSGSQGPYLCLPCFSLVEKTANARAHVRRLEDDMHKKIASKANALNLVPQLLSQEHAGKYN